MRILVEGTRGKSGIVKMATDCIETRGRTVVGKMTGLEPAIFYKGKKTPIQRRNKKFFIDKENKKILKDYKNTEFQVFENQALSAYTMKAVHLVFKPEILLIPNIRYEHQDTLGETIEEQAKSFAVNFEGVKKVITTERKKVVLDIFKKYCDKYKVKLIVVDREETVPGINTIYLIGKLMEVLFGKGLTKEEFNTALKAIYSRMVINYDTKKQIHFFKGSKVNDVESARNVYEFMKNKTPKNFCFVCYFRKDRPERTKAFISFFDDVSKDNRVSRVYISGSYISNLPKHNKIIKVSDEDKDEIFDYCKKKNLVMFTAVNGVNPFMQDIELNLQEVKK